MLNTGTLHHVSLPVSDIDRAKAFYGEVLGLEEDRNRPDFDFKGAWYNVGDRKFHLIVANTGEHPTFRFSKAIDSHDRILRSVCRVSPVRLLFWNPEDTE
jgi:catechol 2,3-dioxygenase-like lactoylglutathione lyase family enzyme